MWEPYSDRVIRLCLTALCALALALSPAATSGAIATPAGMPGCTMDGHMPAKPTDHAKMDCCTPACQVTAAAAFLPAPTASSVPLYDSRALHARAAETELASVEASALDPPPRTCFS